jgi:UDP-glucose 4-epimerase
MVILVTGGSGFIGSHVVDELKVRKYDVRVFDKVKPLRDDVEWFKGDLLNERELLESMTDADCVLHLAAVADVNVALQTPELCVQVNELGTVNLLKAATAKEVDRVVLASSTWVYGRAEGEVTEESPLPVPDNVYTKTKIGQEHLVQAWNRVYGLPYTILRYDIPYGPRMRGNMAIAAFTRRALRGEAITLFGDGSQGRCFIHVEDLAKGNVAALKDKGKNQVFNLAGNRFVTILDIVTALNKLLGRVVVEHAPPRAGDFKGVRINIEKSKTLLEWTPKVPFEEGLEKYIQAVRKQMPE